ncbi:ABC transporter ATP-binding protein/permease [Sphingomonas sp. 28-63-12]|uniref:ABC transporter ATP-binding protein/permease n=1 Tax=Sphingomonas sp. 28-63-12 TaxID=1970434 RepID=UPI000BCF9323|nr:MAG: cysteine ABC transporter permease [Sphingomonas sp. 28-63-12]
MSKLKFAGLAWLVDLAGAALFAWGIADAISGLATGRAVPISALAAMVAGGLVRAAAVQLVHALAIRGAQSTSAALRDTLLGRLLGARLPAAPLIGQAAVLAIDHPLTIEQYEARFVPARMAAAAAPLVVLVIVALASWVAAGILMATLIPFVGGMILTGSLARAAAERQLVALGQLSGLFVDRVRTLPIIRHFGADDRIARQVEAATRDVADRTIAVLRAAFLSSAVMEFFAALSVALVAVYCGFSLLKLLPFPAPETLTLREAFFALAMAPEFYLPMRRLAAAYHEKQLGEAAMAEVQPILDAEPPLASAARFGGASARRVTIPWPGRRIGPIDLEIGPSGMVALTGATGSGKTSMLAVIAGQIMPSGGSVTAIAPGDIAWAAQRPLILPGSLRDNLALARADAADADILRVAARVGLMPLLADRPEGLDLPLDHRGSGLSGGERRRIGLARALLSGRPLLLCDEPTADLDADSADGIIALLADLAQDRAVIVATHDSRLIAVADREIGL